MTILIRAVRAACYFVRVIVNKLDLVIMWSSPLHVLHLGQGRARAGYTVRPYVEALSDALDRLRTAGTLK